MFTRSAGLAVLGLGMLIPPATSRTSVTTRYRVETRNETTVDLSGFGQPSQQINFELVSWIAVSTSDTTGGRVLHVVVDSMHYAGTAPAVSQITADSARGAVLHGFVDPAGRVKQLSAKPENVLLSDVQGVLHSFFPRVKPGAKTGDVWSDTVEVTNSANGASVTSTFVINYTAAGQQDAAGTTALKLSSVNSATISGTMENPQIGTMEVGGTVTGTSTTLLAPDGRYLGGTSNSSSDQSLKSAMIPSAIPVKVTRIVKVTALPYY